MNDSKRSGFHGLNVGTASFLVVFTILALITFAVLSVASAQADRRLSDETLANTTAYYTADSTAQRTLASIDTTLATLSASGDTDAYLATIPTNLPEGCVWDAASRTIHFETPITDTQTLAVTLTVLTPTDGQPRYQLTQHQVQGTDNWKPSDSLDVITIN